MSSLTLAAVLAGCGSGGDQPSASQTTMTGAPKAPASQTETRADAFKQGGMGAGMNPNLKNAPVLGSGIKEGAKSPQ